MASKPAGMCFVNGPCTSLSAISYSVITWSEEEAASLPNVSPSRRPVGSRAFRPWNAVMALRKLSLSRPSTPPGEKPARSSSTSDFIRSACLSLASRIKLAPLMACQSVVAAADGAAAPAPIDHAAIDHAIAAAPKVWIVHIFYKHQEAVMVPCSEERCPRHLAAAELEPFSF